jgi:hypothetical protein
MVILFGEMEKMNKSGERKMKESHEKKKKP